MKGKNILEPIIFYLFAVQQSLQDMAEQNRKIIANQVIIIDLLQQQQQSDQQLQATRVEETILFKATNLQELDQLDVSLNSEGSKTAAVSLSFFNQ